MHRMGSRKPPITPRVMPKAILEGQVSKAGWRKIPSLTKGDREVANRAMFT